MSRRSIVATASTRTAKVSDVKLTSAITSSVGAADLVVGEKDAHEFVGSPVLFIVGNADSYRQVRSLGSVAYRMGDKQRQLDFFSIDFNEELSALFGGVLEPQAEFVAHAIRAIRALYKTEQSVILVGNSIGGLLSRMRDANISESTLTFLCRCDLPATIASIRSKHGAVDHHTGHAAPSAGDSFRSLRHELLCSCQ